MNQHFEMVNIASPVANPVKENRLTTLKSYLASEEKSADRSQQYVDDLKDSIERLQNTRRQQLP